MNIVDAGDVLVSLHNTLGVPLSVTSGSQQPALLAELVRRIAATHCPCSPLSLKTLARQALEGIVGEDFDLVSVIDEIIESLQTTGDLIEISKVALVGEVTKGNWLFAASPSFVETPSGTVHLLGMGAEETLPLPDELRAQVSYREVRRLIEPKQEVNIPSLLKSLGFVEREFNEWLGTPVLELTRDYINRRDRLLNAALPSGHIADLRIYFPKDARQRYKDRWVTPTLQTGRFVGRRPKSYGDDLWCFIELDSGIATRFIDLPTTGGLLRGCDEAWLLLLATMAQAGNPQTYRVQIGHDEAVIDLFFPIPIWAQRRFSVTGVRQSERNALMSYKFVGKAVETETTFLRKHLWLGEEVA
jgi:hypothetical protein